MNDDEHMRLVVMGAGRVGKTCLLHRLFNNSFKESYKPTVEDRYCKKVTMEGATMTVQVFDTAGDLKFPDMMKLHLKKAHAFLLVFSIDDLTSFEEVKSLWKEIKEEREHLEEMPKMIAANKTDLVPVAVQLVAMEEPEEWAMQEGLSKCLAQVSAKSGDGVRRMFRRLAQQAKAVVTLQQKQLEAIKLNEMSLMLTRDLRLSVSSNSTPSPSLKRHASANSTRLNPHMIKFREKQQEGLSRSKSLLRRVRKSSNSPSPSFMSDDECFIQ